MALVFIRNRTFYSKCVALAGFDENQIIEFRKINLIWSAQFNQTVDFFGWISSPHKIVVFVIICQSMRVNCIFCSFLLFTKKKVWKFDRFWYRFANDGIWLIESTWILCIFIMFIIYISTFYFAYVWCANIVNTAPKQ